MSIKEIEALARQLWAIHMEALGCKPVPDEHYTEDPKYLEAWIQVAQFVEQRETPPQVIVFNDMKLSDFDRDALLKRLHEKRVWDKDRFNFDEAPDHR